MRSTHLRTLGLSLVTVAWLALTGWVVCSGSPPRHAAPRVYRDRAEAGASGQEPPPPSGVWDRLTAAPRKLWPGSPTPATRDAIRDAMMPLGAPGYHARGHRGQGIKIAVLDSGFRHYREAMGKVLPAAVRVRSFRKDGQLDARDSQHGVLCGEVIHHLAPDAELLFANWEPEMPESFLDAVRWARREGAQVLSCSMIMPCWSDGEGGGPVHRALRELLGSGTGKSAALFFASAGNTAQRHWGGPLTPNRDGWHQWVPGKIDNPIRPYVAERVSVELTSCDREKVELLVLEAGSNREIGRQASTQIDGSTTAVVRFVPQPGRRYLVRVRHLADRSRHDTGSGRFHLTVLGGKLQYQVQQGSIAFPGDGAEVVAVAAVDGKGRRQSYSSCGPLRHTTKPDLAATVPFPTAWRPEQPFSGTSAAAPQAAALAALVWSRQPQWTAAQVRAALQQAAARSATGHSVEVGHGLARLPR